MRTTASAASKLRGRFRSATLYSVHGGEHQQKSKWPGSTPGKATQALRHSKLLLALEQAPSKDFEVLYLFYDVVRPDAARPLVCEEPDYPEELKEAVRCLVW